jgi:hypothetical protein
MPLTAAPTPPAAKPGAGETVIEAPLTMAAPTLQSPVHPGQQASAAASPAPQVAVAVPPVVPVVPAAIPPAPEPTSERVPDRGRMTALVALAAAVIGLVVLGLFWLNHREEHKNVPLVEDPPKDAGTQLVDDDNDPNTPPVIAPVAPLVSIEHPPHDGGHLHRHHHEGGAGHPTTTAAPHPTPRPTTSLNAPIIE